MQDLVDEETQQIFEWPGAQKSTSAASKTPVDGVLTASDDRNGILSMSLNLPPRAEQKKPHILLVTVVDRSGSMRGYWDSQVLPALNSMAQIAWNLEGEVTSHILTYATNISTISLGSRAAFQNDLSNTRASGGTHFSKAFKAIQETLEKMVPPLKKVHGTNLAIVVAFMTDGEDSEGLNSAGLPVYSTALGFLKSALRTNPLFQDVPSVFHALAFGANHDFPFLDSLRAEAGTVPGGFQYAEPSDGAAALKTKLDAIVNSLTNPAVQVRLRLRLPGYSFNVGTGLLEDWNDGDKPMDKLILYPPGSNKLILNITARPSKSAPSSSADALSSSSSDYAAPSSNEATPVHTETTDPYSYTTPVNTSAGFTYATDYYGQVMPSFPQPGMSYSSLYTEDPYLTAASFGPQPGMSHSFDFGPQPGSSFSTFDAPAPSEPVAAAPVEPVVAPVEPTPVAAHISAATTAAAKSDAPEFGTEFLELEVFQTRQDDVNAGELPSTLKIRVDRVHNPIDTLSLEIEKIKILMEAIELEATTSILSNRSASTDFSKYATIVNGYEKKLNAASQFVISMPKSKRTQLLESMQVIRDSFTRLHAVLAQASKGGMSTSQLARMAEVAHGAQFSKARHARTMDSRSTKNAADIDAEAKKLRSHNVNADAVTDVVYAHDTEVSEKLLREWFCVLTQDNWMNLLIDEKDCIGFGIALRRPEFVVDDPTQVRILDMSLTCVSKSAFEHVLTHKLIQASKDATDPIQAKLAFLGGFNVEGKDLGVVVRGAANEPINAWLPLYINEEHWKLAFMQFKSMTGYLVTLNPLGFALAQVDVYFMILATMIVRMKVASNRQVEVAMQYLRTCVAILNDFPGYKDRALGVLKAFIANNLSNPLNRLKDVVPSLLVVMGYLLVMPLETLNSILPSDESWTRLWINLFTELSRRALDSCSRFGNLGNEAESLYTNLISRLVDGYLEENELDETQLLAVFSPEESANAPPPPFPKTERTFRSFSTGPSATDAELDETKRLKQAGPKLQLDVKTTQAGEKSSLWSAFWDAAEKDVKEDRHPMEWTSLRTTDDARVMPARLTQSTNTGEASFVSAGSSHVNSAVTSATFRIPTSIYGNMWQHYGSHMQPFEEASSSADSSSTEAGEAKKAATKANRESLVDGAALKKREFKVSAVLPKTLEAIHLCENVVANFGQPTVEGLINVMTFLKSWINLQVLSGGTKQALADLDANLGVAPMSWLIHLRDDWARRPHMRNSFFTFLNFVDVSQVRGFMDQAVRMGVRSEVLQLQMLRAALAQNARYAVNRNARAACEIIPTYVGDLEADIKTNVGAWQDPILRSENILVGFHKERIQRLISAAASAAAASASQDTIKAMVSTSDIFAFIGMLISGPSAIGTTRSTVQFQNLINAFTRVTAPVSPLAALKLSILLSGRFVDPSSGVVVVIISGREWIPGRKHLCAFHRAWGLRYKQVTELINLTYIKAKTEPVVNLDQ